MMLFCSVLFDGDAEVVKDQGDIAKVQTAPDPFLFAVSPCSKSAVIRVKRGTRLTATYG